jgi:hypothetical protein
MGERSNRSRTSSAGVSGAAFLIQRTTSQPMQSGMTTQ